MKPKTPFTCGCACGVIRYESSAEPLEMFQCHFRDCQRASGGVGAFTILVPKESFARWIWAGPDQDINNPLGVGGIDLHQWLVPTRAFQKMHGRDEGRSGVDNDFAERGLERIGAWILGRIAIWPRKNLAKDSGLPLDKPSATEFSIGHNIASKALVDAVMQRAKNAGAVIVKPAQDTFWGGYAGYFQDPDGHLWEVASNPQWPIPNRPTQSENLIPAFCTSWYGSSQTSDSSCRSTT